MSDEKKVGLECRHCGCNHFITHATRKVRDGVVRYKTCRNCGKPKRTTEKSVSLFKHARDHEEFGLFRIKYQNHPSQQDHHLSITKVAKEPFRYMWHQG